MGAGGVRRGDRQSKEVGLRRPLGHFSFLRSPLHRLDPCILTVCSFSFGGTSTSLRFLCVTDVVVVCSLVTVPFPFGELLFC